MPVINVSPSSLRQVDWYKGELQEVLDFEYMGIKPQRGCIPETALYKAHLPCGHYKLVTRSVMERRRRFRCDECK